MKIAVSGKGGVGKTTVSAMLAGALALEGHEVIALDADPDANLGSALGVPDQEKIRPLAEMEDLIKERTGASDAYGGYFQLNPKVDDIPDKFARHIANIHLLVLGGISKGGSGCICPATALVKALLTHVVIGRDDAVIMDMEAGIEHLGRATAQSMDALLLVVDRGPWSVQTARRVQALAADIGLRKLFAVANRVDSLSELDRIAGDLGDIPLVGRLPSDDRLASPALQAHNGTLTPGAGLAAYASTIQDILNRVRSRI